MEEDEDGLYDIMSHLEEVSPDSVVDTEEKPNEPDEPTDDIGEENVDDPEDKDEDKDEPEEVEPDLGSGEPDESAFEEVVGILDKYGVNYELGDESQTELEAIDDPDERVKRYLELQNEAKDKLIDDKINDVFENINPEIKPLIDIAISGGNLSDIIALAQDKNELKAVSKDELASSKDLQISEIKEDLKSKGLDEIAINAIVEKYDAEDKLEQAALSALDRKNKKIADIEQSKIKEQENIEQGKVAKYNEWKKDIESHIDNSNEIVPGLAATKQERTKLKKMITEKVDTIDGPKTQFQIEFAKDPVAFNAKVNFLLMKGIFSDKNAWDKVVRNKVTKQNKGIIDSLKTKSTKGRGSGKTSTGKSNIFELL